MKSIGQKVFISKSLAIVILVLLSATVSIAGEMQYDIRVDGITCPFCVATSEKELQRIAGVSRVTANLEQGVIMVCADDSVNFTDEQLRELFLEKGFTYREFSRTEHCNIVEQD